MDSFRDRLAEPLVWLIAVGALVFPFSVAGANTLFALTILLSIVSGHMTDGLRLLRQKHLSLLAAICLYLLLMLCGLAWSLDRHYGMEVISHQWIWLLLPVFAAVATEMSHRRRILLFLSIGLTLHLIYCILQGFGLVELSFFGSGKDDPTGYIGHIGFGFVYAIWGGWLLHSGWQKHGWLRWIQWLLAAWALVMVFAAQGRSGYLISLAILLLVFYKHAVSELGLKRSLIGIGLMIIAVITLAAGPGKERVTETVDSIASVMRGDLKHAEARWLIWYGTVMAYREHPVLGVGTGGFPSGYNAVTSNNLRLKSVNQGFNHPHNIYLQALVRWGPFGVIMLIFLLIAWMRHGGRIDWMRSPEGCLVLISGIAVAVHGFSAVSLEEHFPAMIAIMALGIGLGSSAED